MLIHPWDAAISEAKWQDWLAGHDFGQLAVNDLDTGVPHVIPTHFAVDGDAPSWSTSARPYRRLGGDPGAANRGDGASVIDDYAYIPTTWRAKVGGPDEDGVPTSYYSAVQLTCQAEIVDDPQDEAELLRRQLAHFQPQGDHAQVAVEMPSLRPDALEESAACACTSPASPPSSSTTTTTRNSTAPGSPDASKAADPGGTAPQPPSNAGAFQEIGEWKPCR